MTVVWDISTQKVELQPDLEICVLQRYVADLSKNGNLKTGKGLSPNSVNTIIMVIRSSLSMAYNLGLTDKNCTDKIKRPKPVEKAVESFSFEEQKVIEKADKQRAAFYNYYTNRKWGHYRNYHLIIDSGIGIDKTVDFLEYYVKKFTSEEE